MRFPLAWPGSRGTERELKKQKTFCGGEKATVEPQPPSQLAPAVQFLLLQSLNNILSAARWGMPSVFIFHGLFFYLGDNIHSKPNDLNVRGPHLKLSP